MVVKTKGRPAGRPSSYSQAVADRVCQELVEGKSLRQICSAKDMPDRGTVVRWQLDDAEFAARCAQARDAQADYMDDLIYDTARATTPDTAQAAKVQISAYQWRAAKLAPKKYGDKLDMNVSGQVEMKMPDEQLNARLLELLRKSGNVPHLVGDGTEEDEEQTINLPAIRQTG